MTFMTGFLLHEKTTNKKQIASCYVTMHVCERSERQKHFNPFHLCKVEDTLIPLWLRARHHHTRKSGLVAPSSGPRSTLGRSLRSHNSIYYPPVPSTLLNKLGFMLALRLLWDPRIINTYHLNKNSTDWLQFLAQIADMVTHTW